MLADLLGNELGFRSSCTAILTGGGARAPSSVGAAPTFSRSASNVASSRPTSVRASCHPRAGAVLVGARAPLLAFNVELEPPATLADAQEIARLIREGGDRGLSVTAGDRRVARAPEHRAGLDERRGPPPHALADVVAAVARHARPARAELIGLAPAAAFDGFPRDLPLVGKRVLEEELGIRRRVADRVS